MPAHRDTQLFPYTPKQLFDMVLDIERYPEFIPWCRAARITERAAGSMLAELVISFNHITESYISRVTFTEPTAKKPGEIHVEMVEGPFAYLTNHWIFTPHADGSEVSFAVDFKFRSKLMDMLVGSLFGRATSKMVEAFRERAEALYG